MHPPIPSSLRVGRKTYRVELVPSMRRLREKGRVYYELGHIELGCSSNHNGRRFTHQEINETFWHELVHAILYEMDHSLHSNEKFVDAFSEHLAGAISSARFG